MNLIFAVVWLIAAAAIFISGDPHFVLQLGGTNLSGGWLALFFALYNVARWWSRRSYYQQRQAELEAKAETDLCRWSYTTSTPELGNGGELVPITEPHTDEGLHH